MVRRKEYRDYWLGTVRCFWCAIYNNGGPFHRYASIAQIILLGMTVVTMILPWLFVTHKTGNHLERIRQVFNFIDGNANDRLDFEELNAALKDLNNVFFGGYSRNDAELVRALLIDRDSPCLQEELLALQTTCAIGDRAFCLQEALWSDVFNEFMREPVRLQDCITSLMDPDYILRTGDECIDATVREWMAADTLSSGGACLKKTSVSIEEMNLYGRHLVPGLPASEKGAANHCVNASVSIGLSVYGALSIFFTLTHAWDATSARCHTMSGRVPQNNFTCVTVVDYWNNRGYDMKQALDPLRGPQQCRELAAYIVDVFDAQLDEGCNITCSLDGRSRMADGCTLGPTRAARDNRNSNSPFHPTCTTRQGKGQVGDKCKREMFCPSCSYPTNGSASLTEASKNLDVHSGSSGTSSVYDVLCYLAANTYMAELIASVRAQRADALLSNVQTDSLKTRMTRTCEALNAAGSYSDGIAIVEDAAGNMTAFPATLPARLLSPFACSCQINKGCETCIIDCVDFYWALPNSSWYPSGVDCSDDRAKIVRTEGSAAFSIYKPVVTNSSSEGIWWDCNGEACEKPPSPVDPEHPYQGTTRSYGSPNIEIVVSKMMSRMCSIALCVLALLGSCLFLQLLNLQIIWTTVRGADDMSVDDAFRLEQRILYSCCFTSVVTLIPAFLYGAYVALFMDDADWGVTHSLGPGWYFAVMVTLISFIPFIGARKSFNMRPEEWKNSKAGFHFASGLTAKPVLGKAGIGRRTWRHMTGARSSAIVGAEPPQHLPEVETMQSPAPGQAAPGAKRPPARPRPVADQRREEEEEEEEEEMNYGGSKMHYGKGHKGGGARRGSLDEGGMRGDGWAMQEFA